MSGLLIGVLVAAIIAIVTIIIIVILDAPFLKSKIDERKFAKEQDVYDIAKKDNASREIVFCDTNELKNEYIKQRIKESKPVSKDELLEIEKAVKDKPYIIANKDGSKIGDYEAIRPEKIDETVSTLLKENDGVIIFD